MKITLASFCSGFVLMVIIVWVSSCHVDNSENALSKNLTNILLADQLKNHGNYDSAILIFTEAESQTLINKDYTSWIRCNTGLIDCYKAKGDLETAMNLCNKVQALAKTVLDTTGNLYNGLIHKKALLFADQRLFEQSAALYSRNIKTYLARSAFADTGLALSYNGMGTLFLSQNKFPEALNEYNKAIETYEKAKHTRSADYTSSLQNIGIVYTSTGNLEKAEQYFLRSLKINQEILKPDDSKLASSYVNMGRFYQTIRNDSKAIEYMKLAENYYISQNQTNSINAGSLFLNMGVFYIYLLDYEKAQSYFNKSLDIYAVKAPGKKADLLTLYLNMGFIAEKKGEYTLARIYYLKGLDIGEKEVNSVKVLRGLANISVKTSDYSSANQYHKKAIQKSIEMSGPEHPETALCYLKYGDFLSVTGNSQALIYLNKALVLYKKKALGKVNIDVSIAYYYMGSYYYRAKKYTKAVEYFQQSLIAGFPGFTSVNIADNPEISNENLNENLLNPLTAKATALLLLYQSDNSRIDYLKGSAASYTLSLKMIEMLRSTYQNEDSKMFISGSEKNTFSNALISQVKLYEKTKNSNEFEQAFSLSEKGKSAVLLSHLRDKEAKIIGKIPSDILAQDASLKSEIFFYNKKVHDQKLLDQPDEEKIKLWNSKIFDLSRKQDDLIKSVEKDYPFYYTLKYDNSVISLAEIQKKIADNQVIVEYTLTDTVLYTFAISAGRKQLVATPIDSNFFNEIIILREQLTGKEYNNYSDSDFKDFVQASRSLYKILLSPVQSFIEGKELIIIPDGELGYLSFDVLLTSQPDTSKTAYKRLPYLIRSSALSYAPSATTFFNELKLNQSKNNGRILAYGPTYDTDNAVLDQKNEKGKTLRNILSNLANTSDEIGSLKKYFNVKAYLGPYATEESFKKHASDYKVLHLAMHTLINNENPLYSKLIFFKKKGDTIEDGMLNASELINMELHADMAVLSACNTGTGKMRKGEGIMSLSRDFFYSGVPGIIMTSWAVEDRTGTRLMDYFYKYIAEGKSRNEALQLAKIDYLNKCDNLTSHPHYWAAYMNVGDISPLKGFGKRTNPFSLYGAFATLLAIAAYVLFSYKKKQ